ncbi:MAG: histidine phosphatase family protein [Hyphomicrobiales bacterium]|nr:histidine phosphatase family protein [Hyphomicrobiales bacterium]
MRTASMFFTAIIMAATLSFAGGAQAQEGLLTGKALVQALKAGGQNIYFRHARTDWSQRDESNEDLSDCKLQRNLSDAGRADAKLIGEGMRALDVPIGKVISSPYCRCRDHAEIAFGRVETSEEIAAFLSEPDKRERRTLALRRMLGEAPVEGNTVIVGHQASLRAAAGLALDEGEAIVFRPGVKGIMIGRVKPREWTALLAAL